VNHDIKCGEEGVHIDHELVPFPSGSGSRPTLERGCLPLKLRADNSHQAFKPYANLSAGDSPRGPSERSVWVPRPPVPPRGLGVVAMLLSPIRILLGGHAVNVPGQRLISRKLARTSSGTETPAHCLHSWPQGPGSRYANQPSKVCCVRVSLATTKQMPTAQPPSQTATPGLAQRVIRSEISLPVARAPSKRWYTATYFARNERF